MKIDDLSPDVKNAVLQSAMRVLSSNGNDIDAMLLDANKLISHEFPNTDTQVQKIEEHPDYSKFQDHFKKLVWKSECFYLFAKHFAATGYPVEHWENTINSELSSYLGSGDDDRWQLYTPDYAVREQLSCWES